MTRFCACFRCRILVVVVTCSFFLSVHTYGVTTSWNTNASGNYTTAANWSNGVPGSGDTAVFNRGFVAYEVNFPGGSIFNPPPPNYLIDYLRVRTNEVSFVYTNFPFSTPPSLTVLNPDVSIIVGEDAGDVAILNMTLNSLSGANASIGRAAGANGTLSVGGTFNLSGALNVGESGTGTLNVTNGGTVASTYGFIGLLAGSSGQVTVSGANSTWTNGNSLTVGRASLPINAQLNVNDGGVVSVTNFLQVNRSGRLAGNGLIQGNVVNSGRIAPGISSPTSVGTLRIDGNYGQSAEGELLIEIGAADSFGKLDVDGNITLGGRLNFSVIGGYAPQAGDTFDILDWTGTQSGAFSDVPPLSPGLRWDTSQLYTSGVLSVVRGYFQPGEFVSESQESWGTVSSDVGQLLGNNFNPRYPGGFEVGLPGGSGFSMFFTSATALFDYLPASGTWGPLNADIVDPTSSASGAFGGFVVALQLNTDFNDSGDLTGTSPVFFGDLVLHDLAAPLSVFNGMSVREFLAEANFILGAGPLPPNITYDDFAPLTETLTLTFAGGMPTEFAQDHLRIPGDFNLDRVVDAADYVVWRKTDGTPAGYNEWRTHFGWTAGSASGTGATENAAVPEPATAVMVLVGVMLMLSRIQRGRLAI